MGVAEPLGISTSLTYSFPQKGFTPWGRNGKAIHRAGPELLQFVYGITKVKQSKCACTLNKQS